MYKVYFKQAWQMLRQNRFVSIIAILGTALAVTMIMTIIVADEIKSISIVPEPNRYRTLYVTQYTKSFTEGQGSSFQSQGINYHLFKETLSELKAPEKVVLVNRNKWDWVQTVNRQGMRDYMDAKIRMANDAYWDVLSFSFVAGRPFDRQESESGVTVAVLSRSMAGKLFPNDDPVGQTIEINFMPFRVIGVVKDVSPVFEEAHGDVWVPVASIGKDVFLSVMLVARRPDDFAAIKEEIRDVEHRFDVANKPWELFLSGPLERKFMVMDPVDINREQEAQSIRAQQRKKAVILVLLLIVPALNLAGFSLSRIKKRMPEVGIRKAFGAKRRVILMQILYENMLTSLIGGVLGLVLSYGVVFWLRHWLLEIPNDGSIPLGTMMSLPVILAVLAVCLVLNLLSAGIPAYRASKQNIVDSITSKEK